MLEPLYVKQVAFDTWCFQEILVYNKHSPEDTDSLDVRAYRKAWVWLLSNVYKNDPMVYPKMRFQEYPPSSSTELDHVNIIAIGKKLYFIDNCY